MQDHAPTIYAYSSLDNLLKGEAEGGAKAALPGTSGKSVTERPDQLMMVLRPQGFPEFFRPPRR